MGAVRGRVWDCACVKAFSLLIGVTAVTSWEGAATRADVIELRGGGQVQGKAVPDPKNKDRVQVWLLRGRNPLTFQKGQVLNVIPQPGPLDGYVAKRAKVESTASAQFELGSWCEQNKLPDLARLHYETALSLDSNFDQAHRKLGHLYQDGVWVTRDDVSAAQGLVKYKGRWVTAEEKAKREDAAQTTAAQVSWLRRIKVLRQAILNGPSDRRREAESQLMAIRDPDAVVPLVRAFGQDEPPLRILLATVLSTIGGPEATRALVGRVLDESDSEVRSATLEHLKERDEKGVPVQFARALASENVQVINRAAWALNNLEAVEAVPRLVSVLITTEQQIVYEPPAGANVPGPVGPGPTLKYMNNSGVILQSPPQVSNGAVAYGLQAIPWYQMSPGIATGAGLGSRHADLDTTGTESRDLHLSKRRGPLGLAETHWPGFRLRRRFLESMGRPIVQP